LSFNYLGLLYISVVYSFRRDNVKQKKRVLEYGHECTILLYVFVGLFVFVSWTCGGLCLEFVVVFRACVLNNCFSFLSLYYLC